jgi:SAM-dependent methyltransferase
VNPTPDERGFSRNPWISRVAEGNGEDFFLRTLEDLAGPEDVVLDLGCGRGSLTLWLAGRCRLAVGVDRDLDPLRIATKVAGDRDVRNAAFVHHFLDRGALPLLNETTTLVANRRGPTADKWITEVCRVVRRPATVLVMHPTGPPPVPAWIAAVPFRLRSLFGAIPFDKVCSWVEAPLAREGITDYRLWWFDVPEWFATAEDLALRLGKPAEEAEAFARAFTRHAGENGLALRQQRLVARIRLH